MLVYRLRPIPLDRDPQMREMIGLAKGFICDGNLNDLHRRQARSRYLGDGSEEAVGE